MTGLVSGVVSIPKKRLIGGVIEWLFGSYAFTPLALFRNSEQGAWYDPSDFSSMFQDSAGTTPVTAVGQPVGRINDKSGNGNHASQATAAARPVLRQDGGGKYYLEFDGVDDGLGTAAIDFSASDEMTVVVAMERPDTATLMVVEFSDNVNACAGSAFVVSGDNDSGIYSARARGASHGASAIWVANSGADRAIITSTHSISGDLSRIRRNGVYGIDSVTDKGAGNFGNWPLYIGSRGGITSFFNGSIYQTVIVGRVATATEIDDTEAHIASKSGVTL